MQLAHRAVAFGRRGAALQNVTPASPGVPSLSTQGPHARLRGA